MRGSVTLESSPGTAADHAPATDTVAEALVQVPQPAPLGSFVVAFGAMVSFTRALPSTDKSMETCDARPDAASVPKPCGKTLTVI